VALVGDESGNVTDVLAGVSASGTRLAYADAVTPGIAVARCLNTVRNAAPRASS